MSEMIPQLWISQITFSDGSTHVLTLDDVIVIVGPNNSGKSATLRSIREKLANPSVPSPVVSSIAVQSVGTVEDVIAWLEATSLKTFDNNPAPTYHALGVDLYQGNVKNWWQNHTGGLQLLTRFFCHHLTADARLRAADAAPGINVLRQPLTHPIHYLYRDDGLEARLSQQFRRAFNADLVVQRGAGGSIPLHVGQRPTPGPGQDRVSPAFVNAVEELPTLESQGDGMRSFAGTLLETSVGRESILLIDEPEAFLHPPQARLLGKMLVSDRTQHRQLIVATHSGDVLRGILDGGSPNVRVIRLQRSNAVNIASQLDNARIKDLWKDPLLRSSNILDGLFHERVVVCEGDSDCRFYAAIADAGAEECVGGRHWPDIMFAHCGGKARLHLVLDALRALDVSVAAVTDFDVFNAEQPLRRIVDAADGDWTAIEADWNRLKSAIDGEKPELATPEVTREIQSILARIQDTTFPADASKQIQSILRRSSPWAIAKTTGRNCVPNGQPTRACDRLMSNLRALGVYVVPDGELESFARSVDGRGPAWVNEVLNRDLKSDPELEGARAFVSLVAFPKPHAVPMAPTEQDA
ncbi:MAG TPA: AAA family ATPase [Thermoanaerobaculia bacterium]|nr:AAA family ATPase [Thermoanaerobaculia bacterium]